MILKIAYKPAFLRTFKKLPLNLQAEVRHRIALFSQNPDDPLLRTHKLKGRLKGRLSFSVNYQYRIVFFYENKHTAVLLNVGDHSIYE